MASPRNIHKRLEKTYQYVSRFEKRQLELDKSTRIVIFSDHHKGAKNKSDFFSGETGKENYITYNTALDYYFEKGYLLIIIGDAEELWRTSTKMIFRAHQETLEREAQFHKEGRYIRLFGNHDLKWRKSKYTRKHFSKIDGFKNIEFNEGLIFDVKDNNQSIGELFITHGHQGRCLSDRGRWFGKFLSFLFVEPFCWLTGYNPNTPANNFNLRKKHDRAMFTWAAGKDKFLLITGHTHRPVFRSDTHIRYIRNRIASIREKLQQKPGDNKLKKQLEELNEKLEDRLRGGKDTEDTLAIGMEKPAYSNTGCCCYDDGDITGLEIVYEKGNNHKDTGVFLKLIQWSRQGNPSYIPGLRSDKLKNIFNDL